ncbi:thiamine pyrophosphate enzyme, C-terminal TPP binding domain protein [Bordetella holmesii 70147]|nr:thiamine pyrophosphate enzyme, C-terminal TPP binding domain protein [Bordetella holmesii 70147]
MWAAQYLRFDRPGHWLTSGGAGTMGYGLPAAIGAQIAHPDKTVVCVSGDASVLMNIQELSTAMQHCAPVKVVLCNNGYMGMVRQWQELIHGGRYSHSYNASLPDFVALARAFGWGRPGWSIRMSWMPHWLNDWPTMGRSFWTSPSRLRRTAFR